jgi:hypothetical protein
LATTAEALVSSCALAELLETGMIMIPIKATALTQPLDFTFIFLVPSLPREFRNLIAPFEDEPVGRSVPNPAILKTGATLAPHRRRSLVFHRVPKIDIGPNLSSDQAHVSRASDETPRTRDNNFTGTGAGHPALQKTSFKANCTSRLGK